MLLSKQTKLHTIQQSLKTMIKQTKVDPECKHKKTMHNHYIVRIQSYK